MVLALGLVLLTAGMAAAAKYPNLIGTWSGQVDFAGYSDSGGFYYASAPFSFNIQSQDPTTGNFYGLESGYFPFTGNVSTNKIITIIYIDANGGYRFITGKVQGSKISGTMQHFRPGSIDTGKFTLIKE
jgi:hypothetical protein